MSIICAFILNQDFINLFSPVKIEIFKSSGLKSKKMMLIIEIGNSIPSQNIQDLVTKLLQGV